MLVVVVVVVVVCFRLRFWSGGTCGCHVSEKKLQVCLLYRQTKQRVIEAKNKGKHIANPDKNKHR